MGRYVRGGNCRAATWHYDCDGSGVARRGAQGARAPPSALGLVDIVYRNALATPNRKSTTK